LARPRAGLVENVDQQTELLAIAIRCPTERPPVRIIQDDVACSRFLSTNGFEGGLPRSSRDALIVVCREIQRGLEGAVYAIDRCGLEPLYCEAVAKFIEITSDSVDAVTSLLASSVPARWNITRDALRVSRPRLIRSVM
jgi:hypothetical protein